MGFEKSEAKRCIREGFHEWERIRNKSEGHRFAHALLGRTSIWSLQLDAFWQDPPTDLHSLPEAFQELQDRLQ
eukprot:2776533-Alexandrium_andersonii.AAC.1